LHRTGEVQSPLVRRGGEHSSPILTAPPFSPWRGNDWMVAYLYYAALHSSRRRCVFFLVATGPRKKQLQSRDLSTVLHWCACMIRVRVQVKAQLFSFSRLRPNPSRRIPFALSLVTPLSTHHHQRSPSSPTKTTTGTTTTTRTIDGTTWVLQHIGTQLLL